VLSETRSDDAGVLSSGPAHTTGLVRANGAGAFSGHAKRPTKLSPSLADSIDGARLLRAIERGKIYPVFQPIVRLSGRSISGFEVLARWHDDELGTIPPAYFIPVAEQTGLISELTSSLIQTACAAARTWSGGFRLAFNISPVQFQHLELAPQIEEAVQKSGFPLSRIQLEITESAVIDNFEYARRSIDRLKMLGVQIALDDFGTGFSSFTRLQALPFDRIKIEAAFVRSMRVSREGRKIVSAVIGLGQSLGMPVVAEGIETHAQLRILRQLGCDFGQGYLFARPARASAIPSLIGLYDEQAEDPSPLDLSCNVRLAQLKAIYACAPIALCFIDLKRRYSSANKRFAEMLGMDLKQIVGRRVEEVYPNALPYVLADLQAAVDGQLVPSRETDCETAGGRRVVLSSVAAARDENNDVVGISVALIDVTRYKSSIAPSLWLPAAKSE
jgi:PAS domain S-box-containing protein